MIKVFEIICGAGLCGVLFVRCLVYEISKMGATIASRLHTAFAKIAISNLEFAHIVLILTVRFGLAFMNPAWCCSYIEAKWSQHEI